MGSTRAAAGERAVVVAAAVDVPATGDIRDAVWRLKSERIVAAAVDLFYKQGYSKTTLDQVAQAIHVTKPFIYSHFKSKNDLLAEICSRAIRVSHEALNRVFAAEISPTEKLYTIARDFMLTVLQHQAHAVIYSREEKELTLEDRNAINALRRGFDRRFASLLEEGVASAEFTVEDVPLTALAIGGIVGWAPVWYRPGGRLSQVEASERVALLVLAMVQAKGLKRRKPKGLLPLPSARP
jgi:AcrR family transcriptional regulator